MSRLLCDLSGWLTGCIDRRLLQLICVRSAFSNSDACPYARVPYVIVIEEMQHLLGLGAGRDDIQTCRQRVGMFGISGELATMPIAVLSGGQKARVQFARVCAPQPHVLVLDEPTNHLGTKQLAFLYRASYRSSRRNLQLAILTPSPRCLW